MGWGQSVLLWTTVGVTACSLGGAQPVGVGGTSGNPSPHCVGGTSGNPGPRATSNTFPMTTVVQPVAPPAISGGTLLVLADGKTAVAADPDRDKIFIADLSSRTLRATVALDPGDEPGRVAEDASGRVHVALRRGGAIVTLDPGTGNPVVRRAVCAAPRGIAYDARNDVVHVACADGQLVSLPAAGGGPVRTLQLDRDLRDVVVDRDRLYVSRFRSAELLTLGGDGTVAGRTVPWAFQAVGARSGQVYVPAVGWRAIPVRGGGVLLLHQRAVADAIRRSSGSYGGADACDAVVHPAISVLKPDGVLQTGPALAGLVLAVDVALSPDATKVAVVSAGKPQVFVTSLDAVIDADPTAGCKQDGISAPCAGSNCAPDAAVPEVVAGQPIAVAYAGDGSIVVQSREPALLSVAGGSIALSDESRADTGHLLFHADAGGSLACASCHAEGNDDGHVWSFECTGTRRTQSLQVGLRGTEPFNWSGNEPDFSTLLTDVFEGFMSGPSLSAEQRDALLGWLDNQPRPPRTPPASPSAVARGKALFEDPQGAGCITCHSGPRFSNNKTEDVGTGGPFQVPSLLGVGTRGPFLHHGGAKTLKDRFVPEIGGGDKHGKTSMLSADQINDLVAYLDSL